MAFRIQLRHLGGHGNVGGPAPAVVNPQHLQALTGLLGLSLGGSASAAPSAAPSMGSKSGECPSEPGFSDDERSQSS